jgi:hypothetical protein
MKEINEMKTKNIKLCAYLRLLGINPIEVRKMEKGKAEYTYDLTLKQFELYQIQFNQSQFLDYANNLDSIKDLAY